VPTRSPLPCVASHCPPDPGPVEATGRTRLDAGKLITCSQHASGGSWHLRIGEGVPVSTVVPLWGPTCCSSPSHVLQVGLCTHAHTCIHMDTYTTHCSLFLPKISFKKRKHFYSLLLFYRCLSSPPLTCFAVVESVCQGECCLLLNVGWGGMGSWRNVKKEWETHG
jgi:hypothetical protein